MCVYNFFGKKRQNIIFYRKKRKYSYVHSKKIRAYYRIKYNT